MSHKSMSADFDGAIRFAQDLIRIPSLPGDEAGVAQRVVEEYEALGFEDAHTDSFGNAIGVVQGTGDGPTVMLSCHLDIVAAGDEAEWEHPPFGGVVEGGFLHGRGAMDIKGPLAIQTHAAAALAGRTQGDVIVAHTVLEERGGLGMKHLIKSGVVKPDLVIIGESTDGDIAIGHRGRAEVEVVIRGVAGHASAPERARNALDILAPVLAAVQDLNKSDARDPVLGSASAVTTGVEVRPESRNVIPDEVVVVVDWRILPGLTGDDLVALLETAIQGRLENGVPEGFEIEVRGATELQTTWTGFTEDKVLHTPGFLVDSDHPAVVAASRTVGTRNGGGAARIRPWTFATDGGWTCGVYGIPSFGFAPGQERYAHTNTERLNLAEAEWAFGKYQELIPAVQEVLPRG